MNLANVRVLQSLHDGDLTRNLLMRRLAVIFRKLGQIDHLHGKPLAGRPVQPAVDSAEGAAAQ